MHTEPTEAGTTLGGWIRKRLVDRKADRHVLARAMGISVHTLRAICNGQIKRPPEHRLRALAAYFEYPYEELLALCDPRDSA